MILSPIFLRAGAKPNARKENNHDDRNHEERGSNVHDRDSSPLEYQKPRPVSEALPIQQSLRAPSIALFAMGGKEQCQTFP